MKVWGKKGPNPAMTIVPKEMKGMKFTEPKPEKPKPAISRRDLIEGLRLALQLGII